MSETALSIENLSKRYVIGQKKNGNLRDGLTNIFSRKKTNREEFWALKNLSLEINHGDTIGIIGRNGAGKSTLLKILSKITYPTKGRVIINGRVASLLEVGTGFHAELTGRENVFLNGTILGMRKKEVKKKFDQIVDFSGIEKFIDTPVKRYSSGMYVRLAFAVAAHLEPEILIVDEVLAVGDAEFQKKCLGKMSEAAHSGRTVLFVSHNLGAVKSLCNKGALLKNGELQTFGEIDEVIKKYNGNDSLAQSHYSLKELPRKRGLGLLRAAEAFLDQSNYLPFSSMKIGIKISEIERRRTNQEIDIALFFFDILKNQIYQLSSIFFDDLKVMHSESNFYTFEIAKLNLSPGQYTIGVWVASGGVEQDYIGEDTIRFTVDDGNIYTKRNPKIVSLIQKEFTFSINDSWTSK